MTGISGTENLGAGICGWLGPLKGKASPATVAARMAEALDPMRPAAKAATAAQPHGAVAALQALASGAGASLWSGEHILCAVSGRPTWDDPALQKTAAASGNARALVEGYALYSDLVMDRIHGAFSLALVDTRKHEAFIAIDRLGIEALTYATGPEGLFVFGATTDAVRGHPGIGATVSPQAVYNYLFNYVVPSPGAIYTEQRKLLPGQFVRLRGGRAEVEFYWEMPYSHGHHGSQAEWAERLWAILNKSFAHSLEGVDPAALGAFLSGGLDSSTVAGLLAKNIKKARTFTIGFKEPAYDESHYARLVAEHFHTEHREYFVTPRDVVDLMPKIAEAYDEPYGNTSAVPTYYCAKMARESGVRVMLAGDGGDEIFAGNERYAHMQRIEKYGRIPGWLRSGMLEPALKARGLSKLSLVARGKRLAERYATAMPERIYAHNYMSEGSSRHMLDDFLLEQVDLDAPMKLLREAYQRPKAAHMLQRMMHLDLKITLADNDLRKVNRMCRLAGVEVRYPLLDDEIVAFSASIPPELLLPGVKLRHFFKQAMRGFLPDAVLSKQKHGFGLPFDLWIKTDTDLQTLVLDHLSAFKSRRYLRPEFIEEIITGCRTVEPRPTDSMAWDVAMLEMWLQKHVG